MPQRLSLLNTDLTLSHWIDVAMSNPHQFEDTQKADHIYFEVLSAYTDNNR